MALTDEQLDIMLGRPMIARRVRRLLAAQDEREKAAGAKCSVPYEQHGCDWPDAVADEVLALRARVAEQDDLLSHVREFVFCGQSKYVAIRCPLRHATRPYWLSMANGLPDEFHDTLTEAVARARELAGEGGW